MSEAAVIYQELGERHNWTAQLYNGAAACAMQLGNWEEAEQYLQVSPDFLSWLSYKNCFSACLCLRHTVLIFCARDEVCILANRMHIRP